MLFRMAGGVSDTEIASGNKDFENLLSKLTGKNLEEYKREIQAKKRRIKNEVEMIPSRIDERKRDMPEEEDWVALDAELTSKKEALSDIEKQLLDISKSAEASSKERAGIARQLGDVKSKKSELQFKLKEQFLSDYRKQQSARNQLMAAISAEESTISTLQRNIKECDAELERLAQKREHLLTEWKQINGEQLTYNEDEFICPTCKRRFEVSEIEQRQQEISDNFLRNKAARLERNKQAGLEIKRKREEVETVKKEAEANLVTKREWVNEQKSSSLYRNELVEPETESLIAADKAYIDLCNLEIDLNNQLANEVTLPDTEELVEGKNTILGSIDELKKMLSKREIIDKNNERIAELEGMLRNQSQELAELEGIEFTISEFSKARIEAVEKRINGMFRMVRFKMYEQQINGGETETCEAMVDGIPYSDLNDAAKINAGLDIINAICKFEDVYVPIFCDNAESVNELLPTQSQMIRLVVTEDEKLVIE